MRTRFACSLAARFVFRYNSRMYIQALVSRARLQRGDDVMYVKLPRNSIHLFVYVGHCRNFRRSRSADTGAAEKRIGDTPDSRAQFSAEFNR